MILQVSSTSLPTLTSHLAFGTLDGPRKPEDLAKFCTEKCELPSNGRSFALCNWVDMKGVEGEVDKKKATIPKGDNTWSWVRLEILDLR